MLLQETCKLMISDNYKDRFIAEYKQLTIRIKDLNNMRYKYKKGLLNFTPHCSYDLLNGQLKVMLLYKTYLEERALIENIEI